MTRSEWERARLLVDEAARLPPADRERFVRERCPDPGLRRQVLDLLVARAPLGDVALTGGLRTGAHLGTFVVEHLLGRGGMGEVYQARDTTLNREVAIKVLPREFVDDPDRVARFRREAQLLAALNHPNIAQIHGFETSAGVPCLVMELVEGPTLADQLAQKKLTLAKALNCATQIADALVAAHERGIIHRDLKPANVKVRDDGVVKVLDFGLAKSLDVQQPLVPDFENSTISRADATQLGMLLGTVPYMAPEQALGNPVDRRADIWAFGCVLYEILASRRAFVGATTSEVLTHILQHDPDWSALPSSTPAAVHRVLRRCLERDPERRLRDIADVRFDLVEAAETPEPRRATTSPVRERLAWTLVTALVLIVAVMLLGTRRAAVAPAASQVVRFELRPPDHVRVGDLRTYGPAVISIDGRRLAFVGTPAGGRPVLWVRALESVETTELPGTDGASYPFWSPDSARLGFFADGKLKTVRLDGSAPEVLGEAPIGRGGTWSAQGQIVFAPSPNSPLMILDTERSSATPVTVSTVKPGADQVFHPRFLPDGLRFLFLTAGPSVLSGTILLGDLQSAAAPQRYSTVTDTHSNVIYSAASEQAQEGYLLFIRESSLMAYPVDAATLAARGEAQLVASGVRTGVERWLGDFSASFNGVLVYRRTAPSDGRLAWRDRRGRIVSDLPGAGSHRDVSLSPDRTRLAVQRFEASPVISNIWIRDLARGVESRLTPEVATHYTPVWTADGEGVIYAARTKAGFSISHRGLAEGATRTLLPARGDFVAVSDASANGRILFHTRTPAGHFDLWTLRLADASHPTPLLQSPADEVQGQFSPDGHWLAYVSNDTARPEVYVGPAQNPMARVQVSNGGVQPRWRRDGRELFYVGTDGRLMSVSVETTSTLRFGTPTALFQTYIDATTRDALQHFQYDPSLDGQRFLTLRSPEPEAVTPWTVVTNWTATLGGR